MRKKLWQGRPTGKWITARKAVQYLALLIFIGLFVWSRRGGWPGSLVNIPMRLDPLATLAHLLASHTLQAGSALALITVGLTLVFGRAWCGWLCPLGTTLDLVPLRRTKSNRLPEVANIPDGWRKVKYLILLTLLAAALLGNLTLLVFDPLTIMVRTLSTSIWPAVDQVVTQAEAFLYKIPILSGPISNFDAFVRPKLLPPEPVYYRDILLFAIIFLGIIALNRLAPRFWCRYLCPLGGLLGLLSKIALFRHEPGEGCKGCAICTRVCPTGTIDPRNGYTSDPSECTMCLDCLESCPRSSITFDPRLSLAKWNTYDPGRREALVSISMAIAGLALMRSDQLTKRESPHLIRPPGARENNFIEKCVRCAECVRACPTSALQPAISEAGLEGLWTPLLIPRLGYCDYSCNACGLVCPVQAIPPLSLDDKRLQVIGKAYIDQNRCIAWADHTDCIVCEEMCPIADKAIRLKTTEVTLSDDQIVSVQLPEVLREKCIGCGICEYKCPVNGEAAIRIFVPSTELPF